MEGITMKCEKNGDEYRFCLSKELSELASFVKKCLDYKFKNYTKDDLISDIFGLTFIAFFMAFSTIYANELADWLYEKFVSTFCAVMLCCVIIPPRLLKNIFKVTAVETNITTSALPEYSGLHEKIKPEIKMDKPSDKPEPVFSQFVINIQGDVIYTEEVIKKIHMDNIANNAVERKEKKMEGKFENCSFVNTLYAKGRGSGAIVHNYEAPNIDYEAVKNELQEAQKQIAIGSDDYKTIEAMKFGAEHKNWDAVKSFAKQLSVVGVNLLGEYLKKRLGL